MTKWYIKIIKDEQTIHSTQLHDYRRIIQILQAGKKLGHEIYIRANYGIHKDSNGELVKYMNEGTYPNYKLARNAAKSFQEVAKEWV